MGLWARLVGREERALPPGALITHPGGSGAPTWALPAPVDADAALRLSGVWACVRLLADAVSTLPVDVYRDGTPIPTPPVLREPAAGQPVHEWLYSVVASLLLRGNAYGLITARSGATLLPAQVELVHPDLVSVTTDPDTGQLTYRVGGRAYGRDEVWHVRAFTMPGVALGLSPVEYARQAIGLGLAAEKFGGEFFGASSIPAGVLTTDQTISPAQAHTTLEMWNNRGHGGRRGTALLTNNLKFQPITVAPEESQFLDAQRFTVAQVARVFGVAPEMIGGEAGNSLTYANTEARALDFLRYSVSPWVVRIESALGRLLPSTQTVKLNTGGLLRATTAERYAAHEVALRAGFLTVDEVRALEDLPPLPGAGSPDDGPEVA